MNTDFDTQNSGERVRAEGLGIRQLRSVLNELEAHFDGKISTSEQQTLVGT